MTGIINIQTAIRSAVEHLHELSSRMSSSDISNTFKDDDVAKIDKLIAAILELEAERIKMREKYETQTILGNKLRHDLKYFPGDIECEAEAAIRSACEKNATNVNFLTDNLNSTKEEIYSLETKVAAIKNENAILHSKREAAVKEHENFIEALNKAISRKSLLQIKLNETRDQIRARNSINEDIEDEIIKVKESLIEDRYKAKKEKNEHRNIIKNNKLTINMHRETNRALDSQISDIILEKNELQKSIKVVVKEKEKLNKAREEKIMGNRKISLEVDMILKENQAIIDRGKELEEEDDRAYREYQRKMNNLAKRLKMCEAEIKEALDKKSRLDTHAEKLAGDLDLRKTKHKHLSTKLQFKRTQFLNLKAELHQHTSHARRLQNDLLEVEDNAEMSKNEHMENIHNTNDEIQVLRTKLKEQRDERLSLQEQRDVVGKELSDYRDESSKNLDDSKSKIDKVKKEHIEMMQQIEELRGQLVLKSTAVKELELEYAEIRGSAESITFDLENKISGLAVTAEGVQKAVSKHKLDYEASMPNFLKVEADHSAILESYTCVKNKVDVRKNNQEQLMVEIEKSKLLKDQLQGTTQAMKRVLQDKRENFLEKMKQNMEEIKVLEETICKVGCQIKKIVEENFKFNEAIEKQEFEIKEFEATSEENGNKIDLMKEEYHKLQNLLWEGWKNDMLLQKSTEERDDGFVESLGELVEKTGDRASQIDDVTKKLQYHTNQLSIFLDKVNTYRPIDYSLDSKQNNKDQVENIDNLKSVCNNTV